MKKTIRTIVGGSLVALGLIFIIVPGPSLILLIPGLFLLSYDYVWAKASLRKCQRLIRQAASKIDKFLLARKYSR